MLLSALPGVALAQDDAAADEEFEEAGVEEIIVTGSRIRRRDFNAPSPITSIDSDQIRNSGVDELYALLINNQGSEVEIPVLRNNKPEVIRVTVPEMDIMGIRFWPFNKY